MNRSTKIILAGYGVTFALPVAFYINEVIQARRARKIIWKKAETDVERIRRAEEIVTKKLQAGEYDGKDIYRAVMEDFKFYQIVIP